MGKITFGRSRVEETTEHRDARMPAHAPSRESYPEDFSNIQRVVEALSRCEANCSYPVWFQVAAAMKWLEHMQGWDIAYDLFLRWSDLAFDAGERKRDKKVRATWEGIDQYTITVKSLFHWEQHGLGQNVEPVPRIPKVHTTTEQRRVTREPQEEQRRVTREPQEEQRQVTREPQEEQRPIVKEVRDVLESFPLAKLPGRASDIPHPDWFRCMAAIYHECTQGLPKGPKKNAALIVARSMAYDWSSKGSKFSLNQFNATWNSLCEETYEDEKAKIGSLKYYRNYHMGEDAQ